MWGVTVDIILPIRQHWPPLPFLKMPTMPVWKHSSPLSATLKSSGPEMCFHRLEMEAEVFKHRPGCGEAVVWSALAQKSPGKQVFINRADCLETNLWGSRGKCSSYSSCWFIAEEKPTEMIFPTSPVLGGRLGQSVVSPGDRPSASFSVVPLCDVFRAGAQELCLDFVWKQKSGKLQKIKFFL